jgi:UPF0755 protein
MPEADDTIVAPQPPPAPPVDEQGAEQQPHEHPVPQPGRLSRWWDGLGPGGRRWAKAGVVAALLVLLFVKVAIFPAPHGDYIEMTIEQGVSVAETARTLEKAGIVPSDLVLKGWIAVTGSTARIMPGEYRFKRGTPYGEVVADLRNGGNIPSVKVVVPEGFTIRQVAARMESKVGIDAKEFERLAFAGTTGVEVPMRKFAKTRSLEGFLFPKTYIVRKDATEQQIIDMMVDQFNKDTAGLPWDRAKSKLGLNPYQVLTIAAMIEKEAARTAERRTIAGVIYNRLKDGVTQPLIGTDGTVIKDKFLILRRLQVDATVLYALGRDKGPLLRREYRQAGYYPYKEYNTYIVEGLPLGPIANPGTQSIYAALVPEDNDYYYYVAKGDGSHAFVTNNYQEFLDVQQSLGIGD